MGENETNTETNEPTNMGEAMAQDDADQGGPVDHEEDGYLAYQEGSAQDENPHGEDSEAYELWNSGWVRGSDEEA
jgi:hypothetical protein